MWGQAIWDILTPYLQKNKFQKLIVDFQEMGKPIFRKDWRFDIKRNKSIYPREAGSNQQGFAS